MRDDPFYLSKALTLKASLGVLSVDGNFEESIAYLEFFVKFKLYTNSLAQFGSEWETFLTGEFKC